MQTYYNRDCCAFEPNLVHLQFGDEHRMPPHSGLVMNMRKIIPLETNTKALSEGDPGDSVMLAETEVTVQLQQYGEYARCTDKLDLTHLDMDIMRRTKLFGDAGSRSIDAVVREELAKCANVIYAGGKTSRAALTPGQADQQGAAPGGQDAQEEPRANLRRLLHRHRRSGHDV